MSTLNLNGRQLQTHMESLAKVIKAHTETYLAPGSTMNVETYECILKNLKGLAAVYMDLHVIYTVDVIKTRKAQRA